MTAPPKANRPGARSGTIFAPMATALSCTARHSGPSGVTPVHSSRGWKSAMSAARPPEWSSWAWERATTSREPVAVRAVIGDIAVGAAGVESDTGLSAGDDAQARGANRFIQRQRFRKPVIVMATASRAGAVEHAVTFGQ